MKNLGRIIMIGILAFVCIIGVVFLGGLVKNRSKDKITRQEMAVLWKGLTEHEWPITTEPQDVVRWKEVQSALDDMKSDSTWNRALENHESEVYKGVQKMKQRYHQEEFVLRDDWYRFYQILCTFFSSELEIENNMIKVVILAREDNGAYFTSKGSFGNESDFDFELYHNYWMVVNRGNIVTVWKECQEELAVPNVLVEKEDGEEVVFFYRNRILQVNRNGVMDKVRRVGDGVNSLDSVAVPEHVGDIYFKNGTISKVVLLEDMVSGKVMQRTPEAVLLGEENSKSYEFDENAEVYQLYGTFRTLQLEDIPIGYEYADFVLRDGRITAVLLTRDKSMESIRVLLKDNRDGDFFYDEFQVTSDMQYKVIRKDDTQICAAGERYLVKREDMKSDDRVTIIPLHHTGTIRCESLQRSQGIPSYRGHIEVLATQEGLVVINEVLLEEYLYTVVPSEMPASYPLEALKAQAVCARTYGYQKMLHALYPQWGAHLDDTTTCQVYHNQPQNLATNEAVRETFGMVAMKDEKIIDTFYYSTSCGFGTTEEIWGNGKQYDYLQAESVSPRSALEAVPDSAMDMMEEKNFQEFIRLGDENDYECEEPWYRWCYHEKVDKTAFWERLKKSYQQSPGKILQWDAQEGQFISKPLPEQQPLYEIEIVKRLPGGVAQEMEITAGKERIKVLTEQLIRTVLPEMSCSVMRWDESKIELKGILPSAFFYMQTQKNEEGEITELLLNGGGYGHGVGMSQNAAACMAREGMRMQDILSFFYKGAECKEMY